MLKEKSKIKEMDKTAYLQEVKIHNKILIVENTNPENEYEYNGQKIHPGYIVDFNNSKMLQKALKKSIWLWEDTNLKALVDKDVEHLINDDWPSKEDEENFKKNRQAYWDSRKEIRGIVHNYDNGNFEIILIEEIKPSYSEEKEELFYQCLLKTPDKKTFLIEVELEAMMHLLMHNSFIQGKCETRIYLGRDKKGNIGLYSETMEETIHCIETGDFFQKKETTEYLPGDIIKRDQEKFIYLGFVYEYFDTKWGFETKERCKIFYHDKPIKKHLYTSLDKNSNFIYRFDNKQKSLIIGHIELEKTALEYYREWCKKDNLTYSVKCSSGTNGYLSLISFLDTKDRPSDVTHKLVQKLFFLLEDYNFNDKLDLSRFAEFQDKYF